MSRSKTQDKAECYETACLLKSKALAAYQPDFARVILKEPRYSIDEAIEALEQALGKGV